MMPAGVSQNGDASVGTGSSATDPLSRTANEILKFLADYEKKLGGDPTKYTDELGRSFVLSYLLCVLRLTYEQGKHDGIEKGTSIALRRYHKT